MRAGKPGGFALITTIGQAVMSSRRAWARGILPKSLELSQTRLGVLRIPTSISSRCSTLRPIASLRSGEPGWAFVCSG